MTSTDAELVPDYSLEEQVGYLLRQAMQRHVAIFEAGIGSGLTPTQWAALSKLYKAGPSSQNQLGRDTSMDVATIKGVVDRLILRGFVGTAADPDDARRRTISLTAQGREIVEAGFERALKISEDTLAPLKPAERQVFVALLRKLI